MSRLQVLPTSFPGLSYEDEARHSYESPGNEVEVLQPRPVSRSETYLCLHSSRSEVSRLVPAGGITCDRSELFSSQFHVNIYYK